MLRGIRVKTIEELKERIYAYFKEVNAVPVVFHWKYKLSETNQDESVRVDTLPIMERKKVWLIVQLYISLFNFILILPEKGAILKNGKIVFMMVCYYTQII